MTGHDRTTVGRLPTPTIEASRVAVALTRLAWVLWVASLGTLVALLLRGEPWEAGGLVVVDGLTIVMWMTVTFFSGIVHSYSRRYMAGNHAIDRFFTRVFGFTLAVMVLVAADSVVLFGAAWVAMGLLMADLIGHRRGWPQARAAASLARRYFLAGSGLLGVALLTLWWHAGTATISGLASNVGGSSPVVLLAAGALLLAAMVQSALVPFHTWLLSSMTAPTPASALMHAGFVNAGGILLVRFAPVVTVDPGVMLVVVVVGAASALLGKILKSVRTDAKSKLGCSTTGQMGFMIMQAGLGFFVAAITHLILHGFYKAYRFLASGSEVTHEHPAKTKPAGSAGFLDAVVVAVTALAGGALFVVLTGKGGGSSAGLLLTLLVVLTVLHAAREIVLSATLPIAVRYGAVPLVALPSIAVYAAVYRVVEGLLPGYAVGQAADLTIVHGIVAAVFLVTYLAIERGVYERSERLYVALLNASHPPPETHLTATEEYDGS